MTDTKDVIWFAFIPDLREALITDEKPIAENIRARSPLFQNNNRYGPVRYIINFEHLLQILDRNKMYFYGVGTNM